MHSTDDRCGRDGGQMCWQTLAPGRGRQRQEDGARQGGTFYRLADNPGLQDAASANGSGVG
jgi:hypothetical protein